MVTTYSSRILSIAFILVVSANLIAQQQSNGSTLLSINQDRLKDTRSAMLVLGSWAVGNIAVGLIGMSSTNNPETKAFHQMNAGWGAVNLTLAGFGYYSAAHADPSSFDLAQTSEELHKMQKILLFNAGLDLAYMAGGLWMLEKSNNSTTNPEQWSGFGKSLLMQGAFLMVFDLGTAWALSKHHDKIRPLIKTSAPMGFQSSFTPELGVCIKLR